MANNIKILISQPAPRPDEPKSPYEALAIKHKVNIAFQKLIKSEIFSPIEFRKSKINITGHTAVIISSRHAADFFFKLAKDMRLTFPESMKYFCTSEANANYLQKHIIYKKRKVFYPEPHRGISFFNLLQKHHEEKFIFPMSSTIKNDIYSTLQKTSFDITRCNVYKTIPEKITNLDINKFDIILLFSPIGVASIKENFPNFKQGKKIIAAFGTATADAVKRANLRLDIAVPSEQYTSMTTAIDDYLTSLKQTNKNSSQINRKPQTVATSTIAKKNVNKTVTKPVVAKKTASNIVVNPVVVNKTASKAVTKPVVVKKIVSKVVAKSVVVNKTASKAVTKPVVAKKIVSKIVAKSIIAKKTTSKKK